MQIFAQNTINIGIDESGRGSLVGSLFVSAAIIKDSNLEFINQINDSKKLNKKKRENVFELIKYSNKIIYSIDEVTLEEIERFNVLQATLIGMERSILKILTILSQNNEKKIINIIIDGNKIPKNINNEYLTTKFHNLNINKIESIVQGDAKYYEIATASIIAKCTRDEYMIKLSLENKDKYLWSKNAGYGTKEHIELIKENGCDEKHRKSFLKD
jgi:ribonuclease HII